MVVILSDEHDYSGSKIKVILTMIDYEFWKVNSISGLMMILLADEYGWLGIGLYHIDMTANWDNLKSHRYCLDSYVDALLNFEDEIHFIRWVWL